MPSPALRSPLLALLLATLLAAGCSDDSETNADGGNTAADMALGEGGAGDTGSSGQTVTLCRATCKKASDCPQGIGFSSTCGSDGYCKLNYCTASSDCKVPGLGHCVDFGYGAVCVSKNCSASTECTAPSTCVSIFPNYKGCLPINTECGSDTQCKNPMFPGHIPGQPHCDMASKYCQCQTDKECQDGKGTATGGTWKCLTVPLQQWKKR